MLSVNGGWPLHWKGWPKIMRTSNSWWFRDKRSNGLGWLSRRTPPSGRSSVRWVRPIWWGFFHGFSPLLGSLVLVPQAHWMEHSLLSPLQNLRVPLPQCQWAAHHIGSALHLQFPLHWTSQQQELQLGNCSLHLPLVSITWNGPAPLTAHLKVKAAWGLTLALMKAASAVGTVLCPSSQ